MCHGIVLWFDTEFSARFCEEGARHPLGVSPTRDRRAGRRPCCTSRNPSRWRPGIRASRGRDDRRGGHRRQPGVGGSRPRRNGEVRRRDSSEGARHPRSSRRRRRRRRRGGRETSQNLSHVMESSQVSYRRRDDDAMTTRQPPTRRASFRAPHSPASDHGSAHERGSSHLLERTSVNLRRSTAEDGARARQRLVHVRLRADELHERLPDPTPGVRVSSPPSSFARLSSALISRG